MFPLFPSIDFSLSKSIAVLLAVGVLGAFDLSQRLKGKNSQYLFACILGTILSLGLIRVTQTLLDPSLRENAHVIALGVLFLVILWKALFAPWDVPTKTTVLGTFVFWVVLSTFSHGTPEERTVRMLAMISALIPAVVWCFLFLEYHRERISVVLLMFFSGMVATVPILFYDALVRRGIELQFFLFRVVPESFNRSAEQFVSGQVLGIGNLHSTLLTVFLSFLIVGLIEEVSKYWVLKRSGQAVFTSIDDVLQLSIIVAIGFSFAENITNPGYFMGFVREYLINPAQPDVFGFLSNVVGRSIMTSMVHIVSTGVMGYFLGLAIFAGPYLEEEYKKGRTHQIVEWFHALLRLRSKSIFRIQMICTGLFLAILLHGLFNFLVTFPDLIPGHPRTIGDLVHAPESSFLHMIAILLFPALFYVVGGFWLLTGLFLRKENMEERGHLVRQEVYVEGAVAG